MKKLIVMMIAGLMVLGLAQASMAYFDISAVRGDGYLEVSGSTADAAPGVLFTGRYAFTGNFAANASFGPSDSYFKVGGTYLFNKNFGLIGSMVDNNGISAFEVGVAGNYWFDKQLYVQGSLVYVSIPDADSSACILGGSVVYRVSNEARVWADLTYNTEVKENYLAAGCQYFINNQFSIWGSFSSNDAEDFQFGLRFAF